MRNLTEVIMLCIFVLLVRSATPINRFETLQSSVKDMKLVILSTNEVYIAFIDTSSKSFFINFDANMVLDNNKKAIATTSFNQRWGMMELSSKKIVIVEGSNLHFIDPLTQPPPSTTVIATGLDFSTDANFLSITPGVGVFYVIRAISNAVTIIKLNDDGTNTSITGSIAFVRDKYVDCAAFTDNYVVCFYNPLSYDNYVSFNLFDASLTSQSTQQLQESQSDTFRIVKGVKTILFDPTNHLVLVVIMREANDAQLRAIILQKSVNVLTQICPSNTDFYIMTECNKSEPQFLFLTILPPDKFIASCHRKLGLNNDFIYLIVKYDATNKSMSTDNPSITFTNLDNPPVYFSYFYPSNGQGGTIVYLVDSEIRYQLRGVPRCVEYVVPGIGINQKGTLDFSLCTARGIYDTGLRIRITKMDQTLQITKGSNAITINQDYELGGFEYNSGSASGQIKYEYKAVGYNSLISSTCDISFNVLGCYLSCASCGSVSNASNMNCITCNTNYYPLRDDSTKCYTSGDSAISTKYVLVNNYWEKCYDTCATCSGQGTYQNMKCLTCDAASASPSYPLDYNTGFCYKSPPPKHYLNNNQYSKCDISCLECMSGNSCTICDTANKYFLVLGTTKCINEATKMVDYPDYYLNVNEFRYEPCYTSCATCNELGTVTDHKCLSCNSGTIPNPVKQSDCVTECSAFFYWYIDNSEYKCTIDKNCPPSNPIYVPDSNQCVKSCLPSDDCIICQEGTKTYFKYNNECMSVCPPGTQPIDETNTCETVDRCMKKDIPSSLTAVEFAQTTRVFAIDYATTYASTDKQVNFVLNSKYSVVIYKNEECAMQFANDLSKLDLANCISLLRAEYNIPQPTPLITLKIDLYRDNQPNQLAYEFYSPTGVFLDLAPCKDEKITVTVPIDNTEGVNITQAREFEKLGVDVYNASDPFFTNICFNFTSEDGTDVPLKDRKKTYYQNASICEDGCTYSGVNLTTKEADCVCEVKTSFITELLDNPITGELLDLFNNANFEVMQCYKEVFTAKYFVKNIGGWIILALGITQTVFLALYIIEGVSSIENYLLQYIKVNPPKKNKEKSSEEIEEIGDVIEIADSPGPLVIRNNLQAKPKANNLNLQDDKSKGYKENEGMIDQVSINRENQHPNYFPHRLNSSSKEMNNSIKVHRVNKTDQIGIKRNKNAMSDAELDELIFEDAVDFDKRGFCTLYWSSLKDKQSIINTFCNSSPLESTPIKAMCFFFGIALYFTFNAVFYSESYISEQFASGDSFDILNLLKNELSRCIYSTMIGVFVGIVLGCLSTQRYRIEILIRREKDLHKFRHEALAILRSTKIKNIVFFVINYVTMIFFWYFVSAFCYCFGNTQVSWLIGGVLTWGITLIFPFALCFLIAWLRIMALKCKCR